MQKLTKTMFHTGSSCSKHRASNIIKISHHVLVLDRHPSWKQQHTRAYQNMAVLQPSKESQETNFQLLVCTPEHLKVAHSSSSLIIHLVLAVNWTKILILLKSVVYVSSLCSSVALWPQFSLGIFH